MRFLWSALFYLATPFLIARLWLKGRGNPAYRERWRERFALQESPGSSQGCVWLHAVSVGETEAAAPLVSALMRRYPSVPVLLTTTTPTGSARVKALFGESVAHVYLPYDLPDAVGRFLAAYRPKLAVFMETEIWPNLFAGCAARHVPLVIVNARLSERSCRGYSRLPGFVARTLSAVSAVAAQTAEDASRFASLRVAQDRLHVLGNLKFDRPVAPELLEQGKTLRHGLLGDRPVWIAASTHEGEEALLLDVHRQLLERYPGLLLILAPRHPERRAKVSELIGDTGMTCAARSQGEACQSATRVFLLDTLGELNLFYASADLAFVGGSLVAVGGHNVLEPAILGLPVLFGPHMFNFKEIAGSLLQAGGALQVQDDARLAERAGHLLGNAQERAAMGGRAQGFVERNRGALERHVSLLEQWLG